MDRILVDSHASRRLRRGYGWIFSNQVRRVDGAPAAGDVVNVVERDGSRERDVASAFYNPHSLIALRLISLTGESPDRALLSRRLRAARDLRFALYPGSDCWRLCHGEADFMPGLFVDRFGSTYVVQALSAGMDRLLPEIAEILVEEHAATTVLERDESHLRSLEGLPQTTRVLAGEEPRPVAVNIPPLRLTVDTVAGQKTGAFLDQRENRAAAARHAMGRSVLDVYCNAGTASILAALAGAERVVCVDSSQAALDAAARDAAENGVAARCELVRADAVEEMDARHRRHERHGLVLVDPPSFTRSRKHVPQAKRALRDVNRRAMTLVEPGGILVSSDCSHHVREDAFLDVLCEAAAGAQRVLRILEVRSQAPDHPVLAEMPETRYLKCVIANVL